MTTFERLAQRLKNNLGLDVDVSSFKRTYASKWMKSDGAFVWTCKLKNNSITEVGSSETATNLIKSKSSLTMNHIENWNEIEIFGN